MRRALVILASVVVTVVVPLAAAPPAMAHVCAQPVEVEVGEPAAVTVGIGAESAAVTAVEIEVPDGFELSDASGDGWDVDVQEDVVRFTGGSVAAFACGYVTVRGVAEERAALVFPLTMTTEDGRSVTYDHTDPFREDSAMLVYAGVPMPTGLPQEEESGRDPVEVAGWVLLGGGGLLAGVLGASSWRRSRAAQNEAS